MAEIREVNADLSEHVMVHSGDLAWEQTDMPGIRRKVLQLIDDPTKGRETALLEFEPGAALVDDALGQRTEVMVIEGAVSDGMSRHGKGVYLRHPPGARLALSSEEGSVVLVRRRRGVGAGDARVVHDSNRPAAWRPWGERGAEKVQLYEPGDLEEASWIGRMLPDVQVPEHDHAGGEEIFILDGTIEDASGVGRPGTWMRFPVGFRHAPFSHGDGCVMLVREGDGF